MKADITIESDSRRLDLSQPRIKTDSTPSRYNFFRNLYFPEKIYSTDQLAKVVDEEIANIGLQKSGVDLICGFGKSSPNTPAFSAKPKENLYILGLDTDRTRTTVKHELYHIFSGHLENQEKVGIFKKLLREFSAELYATYGIKTGI